MIQTAVQNPVVQLADTRYRVSLPGYGEVLIVVREPMVAICCSCHRELTDADEIVVHDPIVCARCYPA